MRHESFSSSIHLFVGPYEPPSFTPLVDFGQKNFPWLLGLTDSNSVIEITRVDISNSAGLAITVTGSNFEM